MARPRWTIRRVMIAIAMIAVLCALPFPITVLVGGLSVSLAMNWLIARLVVPRMERRFAGSRGPQGTRILTSVAAVLDAACWSALRGISRDRILEQLSIAGLAALIAVFSVGSVAFVLAITASVMESRPSGTGLTLLGTALVLISSAPFSIGLGFVWVFSSIELVKHLVWAS